MRRRVIAAAALLSAHGVSAQVPGGANRWVDTLLAPYSRRGAPGCAIGVIDHGRLVYGRGVGESDLRRHAQNGVETAFYLASLSKQFTAMSMVLLEQDGTLRLSDDIRKWVPEVPNLGHITLLDLLQHTSGLRDYYTLLGINGWRANDLLTERELLNLVSRQRALNFKPGTEFLYSNTGYALLSVVVRRASGMSLRDFAAKRIFTPLGMSHTQFRDDHTQPINGEAIGYISDGSSYTVSIPQLDVVGDGGVFSTVEDLARWDANLESGQVGGAAGLRLMETPGTLADGRSTGYALGLNVGSFRGTRVISHDGAYGGYRSTYLRFPDVHVSVISLCNVSTASSVLAEQIANLYLPQPGSRADWSSVGATSSLPSSAMRQKASSLREIQEPDEQIWMEGKYFSSELDMEVALRAQNAALVMRRPNGADLTFTRMARDVFTTPDQITLQVERDPAGVVSSFVLSVGRVRNLRFVKRSGVVGALAGGEYY
jgi:CubicO group peptidase (beta-lactamase class C family)